MRSEWKLLMLQVDHSPTTDSAVRDETENYQGAKGTILKCKSAKTCSSTQPCRFPKLRGASNHPKLDHFSIKPPMVTWGSPDFKKPLFVSEDRWLVKNIWMNPSPFFPTLQWSVVDVFQSPLVGGFSIYWECHHPNWRTPSFFRGVRLNHQPDGISIGNRYFVSEG